MGKISKKFKTFLGIIGIGALAFGAIQAINKLDENDIIDAQGGFHISEIEEPRNVKFENNIISWDPNIQAEEYVVKYDGEKIKTKETYIDLNDVEPGTYDIKVKATAKGFRDSNYVKIKDCKILTEEQKNIELTNQMMDYLKKTLKIGIADVDSDPVLVKVDENNQHITILLKEINVQIFREINISFNEPFNKANMLDLLQKKEAREIEYDAYYPALYDIHNYDLKNGTVLQGNIKDLSNQGYEITPLTTYLTNTGTNNYEQIVLEHVGLYKCEKDGKISYIHQIYQIFGYDNDPTRFTEDFNNGNLKYRTKETYCKIFNSPLYVNTDILGSNNLSYNK